MFSFSTLVDICWIIFILYWAINWRAGKETKETAWKAQNVGWIVAWILVIVYFFSPFGKQSFLHQDSWSIFLPFALPLFQLLGILFMIFGLIVAILARKKLADNWSSDVEFKKNHKLITTGIYGFTRHPIYTGVISMGLGTFLIFHSLLSLLFFAVLTVFLFFKLKKEEILLTKHFPNEYSAYKKRAKALIPFIY